MSGIATVCLSINLLNSEQVPAPRTVFIKFPHGASFGEPGKIDQQRTLLRELFWALQRIERPGEILKPDYRWRRSAYETVTAESFVL